ncbi:molybdopterin-dependent oxidoreductase [Streptomyces sp. SID4985]|uniref:molybdopterin-dependent oxidoreductase n=1 Tax=Streptomyces sp. SID4985 TaxID=2690292 RepID=UPI00136EF6B2|nr:molybdopterin-dependent oxidoreductase [Streptomyces sp. SID4985]
MKPEEPPEDRADLPETEAGSEAGSETGSEAAADARGKPIGRRVFLGTVALGALGVATAPALQRGFEALSGQDPTGLSGLLPNGGGFRYYSVTASVPRKGPADYRLTVGGMVDRPHTYTLDDLRALPQTRLVKDVQCVTGWRVPGTPFQGVRLAHLLDLAGVQSSARAIRFTCFDGAYTESLTLDQARRADVLVALRMQDKDIGHDHGGPVRLYVAPMYFYKSAKWLSGITVTDRVRPGYWENRGYDVDAWVGRSNGRTDDPTN